MEYKHIISPDEFINESRRPIEAQKVSETKKDIKVFKSNQSFNIPIDDTNAINTKSGTTFICFENDVFFKNDNSYVKALFETKFLELNKKLFNEVEI